MTDILAAIDAVTTPTCAVCPRSLSDSPSDDFCSPACQHVWHQARADAKAVEDLRRPDPFGYTDGNTYCDDEDCEACSPPRRPVPARIAAAGRNGGFTPYARLRPWFTAALEEASERLEADLAARLDRLGADLSVERAQRADEAQSGRIPGCTGQPDCAGCADPWVGHGSGQPMGILNVDTSAGILAEAIGVHMTRYPRCDCAVCAAARRGEAPPLVNPAGCSHPVWTNITALNDPDILELCEACSTCRSRDRQTREVLCNWPPSRGMWDRSEPDPAIDEDADLNQWWSTTRARGELTVNITVEDRATPALQRLADRVRSITRWPL